MKQIRSDELWGNYSIAGESAGVICRRTPHFDEQSSACMREKLRKKNWSQNRIIAKVQASKFQKQACNSVAASETVGVTSSLQLNKTVVLKLLLQLKPRVPERERRHLNTEMVLSYAVTNRDCIELSPGTGPSSQIGLSVSV